jgi:hypothetical protein
MNQCSSLLANGRNELRIPIAKHLRFIRTSQIPRYILHAHTRHPAKGGSRVLRRCTRRELPAKATHTCYTPPRVRTLTSIVISPTDSGSRLATQSHRQTRRVLGCCPRLAPRPSPQQLAYSPWFARSLPPRTADRFVLVRFASLTEQNATHSRTAQFSGASPDFIPPKPLSGGLLIIVNSVQFHEFQALQALGCSYSSRCPHGQLHAFAPDNAGGFDGATHLTPCYCPFPSPGSIQVCERSRTTTPRGASSRPVGLRAGNCLASQTFQCLRVASQQTHQLSHLANQALASADKANGHRSF